MVNSLSACGNTGNEHGVVILFGGGENTQPLFIIIKIICTCCPWWQCTSTRGVGKRRLGAFKQKQVYQNPGADPGFGQGGGPANFFRYLPTARSAGERA